MRKAGLRAALSALCALGLMSPRVPARADSTADLQTIVERAVQPIMARYAVPGMAVGIVLGGAGHVYDFGVASKSTGRKVDENTLFEIGSVSKTFTASLVSYAEVKGRLSLSDKVSARVSELRGSSFDEISLLNLATHTPGGMPLQFPDDVRSDDQAMGYFKAWKPTYPPGTMRTYSNPSIGLLGLAAARSLDGEFDTLIERELLRPLGLKHTYLKVPATEMTNYAQGYTKQGIPTRMTTGALGSAAYGIRATTADMVRFIEANMNLVPVEEPLRRAITGTHTGYYRIGAMTQDLVWEQYSYPVELNVVLEGNSAKISYEPNPAVPLDPPSQPREDVLINKTGSTNGFATYAAFTPRKKIGLVLLANKNFPIEARVRAAYEILTAIDREAQ